MNLIDPIPAAFGQYLHKWHRDVLVGDTVALHEFASRPFAQAAVWAPGRMIDKVDEMLATYRKNDNSQGTQPKTKLPILIACVGKDFVPAGPEYGRNVADYVDVMIPEDTKNRLFQMRVATGDIRAQVALIAADAPTAKSMAMQLHLYMAAVGNRVFYSTYKLAGFDQRWPCELELPDIMAVNGSTDDDVKNLTVLVLDVQFRANVPFLKAPKSTEPNDGKGSGPNQDNPFAPNYDPNGYLTVREVNGEAHGPYLGSPAFLEWTVKTEDAP